MRAVVPFRRVEAIVMLIVRRTMLTIRRKRFQEGEKLNQIMYDYDSTSKKRT